MNSSLELLYLIIFTGILAVAYSYLLSGQILSSSAGNDKMKEIAEAIQIGARAYLNRQYKTIAIVGVIVLAIVTYFFSYLVGIGYFIGAFLASLSRSSFSVLLVALVAVEVYKLTQSSEKWRLYLLNAFKRIFPIIVGSMALGFIQVSQGADSYFKYIEVLKYWENELSIPHNISDWSHEGFGMSVGFLISISLPLMAWVMHPIISGLKNLMNTQILVK